jgi:hypothetical protein
LDIRYNSKVAFKALKKKVCLGIIGVFVFSQGILIIIDLFGGILVYSYFYE